MAESAPAPQPQREFDLGGGDNTRLANLCGALDENLRLLEERLGVRIRRRGDTFRVGGELAAAAEETLRELFELTRTEEVTPERVHLALRDREAGAPAADADLREHGVHVPRGGIRARGRHQRDYLAHIRGGDLTFGIGPAGTGKTYLAVACAVEALQADRVRRIVLVRPAVEAGERLGFLPGDLTQKVDPYLRPMYDALFDLMDARIVERALQTNEIEIAPLAFMRGRTLSNAVIILDEAQNTTSMQMKMFLTRLGENSRMIITGDPSQVDLPPGQTSGLAEAVRLLSGVEGIGQVVFTHEDVIRHDLVAKIVAAYDRAAGKLSAAKAEKAEKRADGKAEVKE
jgi:phosphate starvation-inducible protein PhoH and related proteins